MVFTVEAFAALAGITGVGLFAAALTASAPATCGRVERPRASRGAPGETGRLGGPVPRALIGTRGPPRP